MQSAPTRRLALASLAGAAATLLEARGRGTSRVLVCIYMSGGGEAFNMAAPLSAGGYQSYADSRGSLAVPSSSLLPITSAISQERFGMHPSLAGLRWLFELGSLAILRDSGSATGHTTGEMDYVPAGFAAPAWITKAAGSTILSSLGIAFTFRSGLMMLSPDGYSASKGQLDNPVLLNIANRTTGTFPHTHLGRQLSQVAGLVAGASALGLSRQLFVAFMGGPATAGGPAAQEAAHLLELNDAMMAFHGATRLMGMASNVTTFTDSDFDRPSVPGAGSAVGAVSQLVMGSAVIGTQVYGMTPGSGRDESGAALATWAGYRTNTPLPGSQASGSGVRFLV